MNSVPIWKRATKTIGRHLNLTVKSLDQRAVSQFLDFILETKHRRGVLYLIAAGRSLDVLRIFGARISQDPLNIVARPIVLSPKPHIEDNDSALICSGTGETAPVISMAESWVRINKNIGLITSTGAKKYGARIFDVVSNPSSLVLIPSITKRDFERRRKNPNKIHSPLPKLFQKGTLIPSQTKFELMSLVLLEGIIPELLRAIEVESNTEAKP